MPSILFDFPFDKASIWTALYSFLFWGFLTLYIFTKKLRIKKKNLLIFFIGWFFITDCYSGDFFHLMGIIQNYNFVKGSYNYGEEIYGKLAKLVSKNYFLFRIIVWGGAFALFCLTSRRFKIPVFIAVVALFVLHSCTFTYARASLSMALFFCGLSFIIVPIKNLKLGSFFIAILLMYVSTIFHNSAWIMIAIAPTIFMPINKKTLLLFLIIIPILIYPFGNLLYMIINTAESMEDSELSNRIVRAGAANSRQIFTSSSSILNGLFQFSNFYVPMILFSIIIFKSKLKKLPKIFRKTSLALYRISLGFTIISIFLWILGSQYWILVYRIMYLSMIPMTYLVSLFYRHNVISRNFLTWIIVLGIMHQIYVYAYHLYCVIATPENAII